MDWISALIGVVAGSLVTGILTWLAFKTWASWKVAPKLAEWRDELIKREAALKKRHEEEPDLRHQLALKNIQLDWVTRERDSLREELRNLREDSGFEKALDHIEQAASALRRPGIQVMRLKSDDSPA